MSMTKEKWEAAASNMRKIALAHLYDFLNASKDGWWKEMSRTCFMQTNKTKRFYKRQASFCVGE